MRADESMPPAAAIHQAAQGAGLSDDLMGTAQLNVERLEIVTALHRLVADLEFDVEIEEAIEPIADRALALIPKADDLAIGKVDGPDVIYSVVAGRTEYRGTRTSLKASLVGRCVASGETAVCHDIEVDDRVDRDLCRAVGIRSMVIVPLRHRGQVIGAILVSANFPGAFLPSDVYTIELIAGALSVAYGHAADIAGKRVLLTAVSARQRLLESLLSIQRAISNRKPLPVVLDAITREAAGLLDQAPVTLILRQHGSDRPTVASTCRPANESESAAHRLPVPDDSLVPILTAARAAMDADTVVTFPAHQHHSAAGIMIATPVHVEGDIGGSLVAHTTGEDGRIPEQREMLAAFAQQVSLALTDAQAAETIREAYHDSITGLPNRALFLDRLDQALATDARSGKEVTVLFVDLDHFKEVNDSLGHAAGDELLAEVARRIRSCVRRGDSAARLGGDEFAVMLHGEDCAAAVKLGERIIRAIREPFRLQGRDVFIAASVGVASSRMRHANAAELLSHADVAMYSVKKSGPGRTAVFRPDMHSAALRRLELHGDLRHALSHAEFSLHYQPLVSLDTTEPVGVEALLRWTHPRRGQVSPADFVPIAEETDLIVDIGRWVLWESARQVTEGWGGVTELTLNVNVSARQIAEPGFVNDVADVLSVTGLRADLLSLELTETVLMSDPDNTLPRLHHLKELGVRLSVDDFGTGYSSLAYLCQFPVDELKVDRSFVTGIGANPHNLAVVRTIVELAHALNLTTVAEGIEDSTELDVVRRLGCQLGQGYHLARPLEPAAAYAVLAGRTAIGA